MTAILAELKYCCAEPTDVLLVSPVACNAYLCPPLLQVARASSCPEHQLLAAGETPPPFERDGVAVNTPVNKNITYTPPDTHGLQAINKIMTKLLLCTVPRGTRGVNVEEQSKVEIKL